MLYLEQVFMTLLKVLALTCLGGLEVGVAAVEGVAQTVVCHLFGHVLKGAGHTLPLTAVRR